MNYRLEHNGIQTASTFTEKEAINLRDRVQTYFSQPLLIIPVETEDEPRPQLKIIEGGRA